MTAATLTEADLRFINGVAARRFGDVGPADAGGDGLAVTVAVQQPGQSAYVRAATLAATLLGNSVFAAAPLQTALLTMHCSLSLAGLALLAPQGVVAGMIKGLAAGDSAASVARWLEDRTVPSTGGG